MEEKGSMMNRTIKAAVGMIAIAAMSVGTLAACGSDSSSSDGKGKVYYLNFKPEANDAWQALAKKYTKKTGVEVKVQTAASGTYEQTLKSEIAKSEAPTLFQVNGPVGYQNWKSYTADMSDTEPYKELIDQSVALKDGDKVVGVPYAMETYGIIYNKDILNKYIATDGAKIKRTSSASRAPSLPPVSIPAQIGASRPIWPTCRCITSSSKTRSPSNRRPSRAPICRNTSRSSTCTSRIPPPSRLS